MVVGDISSTCIFRWQDLLKPSFGIANAREGVNRYELRGILTGNLRI